MKGPTVPTCKRKRAFLDALRKGCTVRSAAAVAGVNRTTPYDWRKNDPAFAEEWKRVEDLAVAELERRAWARALDGESDTMTIFLLKTRGPDCYKQRTRVELSGSARLDVTHSLTGEAAALLEELRRRVQAVPEPPTLEGEAEAVEGETAPDAAALKAALLANVAKDDEGED